MSSINSYLDLIEKLKRKCTCRHTSSLCSPLLLEQLLPFLFNSSHSVESLRRCRRPALLSLLLSYNSSTLSRARRRPPVPPSAAFATGFPRTTPCPSPSHPTQESTRPQEPRVSASTFFFFFFFFFVQCSVDSSLA